jgi:hypothetical protein
VTLAGIVVAGRTSKVFAHKAQVSGQEKSTGLRLWSISHGPDGPQVQGRRRVSVPGSGIQRTNMGEEERS